MNLSRDLQEGSSPVIMKLLMEFPLRRGQKAQPEYLSGGPCQKKSVKLTTGIMKIEQAVIRTE